MKTLKITVAVAALSLSLCAVAVTQSVSISNATLAITSNLPIGQVLYNTTGTEGCYDISNPQTLIPFNSTPQSQGLQYYAGCPTTLSYMYTVNPPSAFNPPVFSFTVGATAAATPSLPSQCQNGDGFITLALPSSSGLNHLQVEFQPGTTDATTIAIDSPTASVIYCFPDTPPHQYALTISGS